MKCLGAMISRGGNMNSKVEQRIGMALNDRSNTALGRKELTKGKKSERSQC